MRARLSMALIPALLLWPALVTAQMTPEDVESVGERNAEVQRAIAWERLQTDITYLRPSAPFKPDQRVQVKLPDPPKTNAQATREAKWTWGIVFLIILVVIVVVFIMQGSRIGVTFRKPQERTRGTTDPTSPDQAHSVLPTDGFLDRIAAMQDRRAALILLAGRALELAADANGMTLARAQTARDVVRMIPNRWGHRDALRKLIRETEIVHFGGRDISEDRWQDCLTWARPIFGTRGTA